MKVKLNLKGAASMQGNRTSQYRWLPIHKDIQMHPKTTNSEILLLKKALLGYLFY